MSQELPPERFDIDAGDDHWLAYYSWKPDRALNPQYAGIPDVTRFGMLIYHRKSNGEPCVSAADFDGPVQRQVNPNRPGWTVESEDPLTLSPSLLCKSDGCGDHGFIRKGRWVRA